MACPGQALFVDPFAGRCVHGKKGARIEAGKLVNPGCKECQKAAEDGRV